jgi:hypothetical protein
MVAIFAVFLAVWQSSGMCIEAGTFILAFSALLHTFGNFKRQF